MSLEFRKLFGSEKAVIGMIHLKPLPSSPDYGGDMEAIYQQAAYDLAQLELAGANAAIVENFNDDPYSVSNPSIVVGAMAMLTDRLQKISKIPLGVNIHFNDVISEWTVAYLSNARFIRVECLVENRVGAHGISLAAAPSLARFRKDYPSDIKVFADINVKHTEPLVPTSLESIVHEAIAAKADALIITGAATGSPPKPEDVLKLRALCGQVPIVVGSGVNRDNIADFLDVADGVIVGSSVKVDGDVKKSVDAERFAALMERVPK